MPWKGLSTVYEIRDARIVVAVDGGGAIVEQRDIEYHEGRCATDYLTGTSSNVAGLSLHHSFNELGRGEPDTLVMATGRVVVSGMTKDGPIEIRGNGEFGYDEHGAVHCDFATLPVILIDEVPKEDDRDLRRGMTTAEWLEHMMSIDPKAPEQFDKAVRGTAPDGEVDEDDDG